LLGLIQQAMGKTAYKPDTLDVEEMAQEVSEDPDNYLGEEALKNGSETA